MVEYNPDGSQATGYTPSDYEEKIVEESLTEFSQLQTWRNVFAAHWEETAEIVLPTSRNTFYYGNFNWPGQKKTDRQVDATAMLALTRFAAILNSLLTPRNMIWHTLGADSDYLMKDRSVRLWYESATTKLFKLRYAPIANFSSQNHQVYQSLGAFGNGGMFVDQAVNANNQRLRALRYKNIPLGELFLRENHQGLIDGFIRWFRLTPQQAYKQFGEMIPDQIKAALTVNSQTPFNFIHRVCPNSDYDPTYFGQKGYPFHSYHISLEGRKLLNESGYYSFPLAAPRYEQTPGEVYGRGPAQMLLPAEKTLNAQKTTHLKLGHRTADPPILTADDGIVGTSMRPGSINKGGVSSDGKPLVIPMQFGNIGITEKMMAEEKGLINDGFLVTLFQILTETPSMTATEVIERVNEKGILLAPTVGRQADEYIAPMVDRELDLSAQLRLLPQMPPLLREARGEYKIEFTSPIARAQKAQEAAGFLRTIETAKEIVQVTQDPSILDNFELDVAMPDIARIQSTPERWLADDKSKAAKRQARAKAQQQDQAIKALPNQAAMVKAQAVAAKAGQGQQNPMQPQQQQQPQMAGGPQ